MPLTIDEYLRKAKETEALAEASRDQITKQEYLEIAARWRRLAEQAKKDNR